jgi:hypothetical protein
MPAVFGLKAAGLPLARANRRPRAASAVCMLRLTGKRSRSKFSATFSEVSMSSDLYGELTDAGRTALEIVRRERAGDLRGVVDLVSTYGDGDKGLIFGAMASIVNHALAAFDELARSHGDVLRGDDLLKAMAVGLQPPGHGPG